LSKIILVTGVAGFIGSHVAQLLASRGDTVIGLDNLNDYYDPTRKRANLEEVRQVLTQQGQADAFSFVEGDIRDQKVVAELFATYSFDAIVHLAAMAGVRVSIENPHMYYDVNVLGTLNLLDAAVGRITREGKLDTLPTFVFASTSSVYGNSAQIPFVEHDASDRPLSPYAASKRAGELIGYSYHHLYGLAFTALRFFTVYGPRGRPDMMAYKVLDNIFAGREVPLYNSGQMYRDWTFVSDIIQGIVGAVDRPLGYEIINLGRGQPVLLSEFVKIIEQLAGKPANLVPTPMVEADIAYTCADINKAKDLLGYDPKVSVDQGVSQFWHWYKAVVLPRS